MGYITSMFGSLIGVLLPDRSYWAVKRTDGKWLCELDWRYDVARAQRRPLDWVLDLVSNGDLLKVREVWLFCPPSEHYPLGQSDFLRAKEPGTLFQLKVGMMAWTGERRMMSQLIGRVEDKLTGECSCKVWDSAIGELGDWTSTVYGMGAWKEAMLPIGPIDHLVTGLHIES